MSKVKDLTGMKFGLLTVIEQNGYATDAATMHRTSLWRCKCECGNETTVRIGNLTRGVTMSCGCLKKNKHSTKGIKYIGKGFVCECGSTKHYAKGLCRNCYEQNRLRKIRQRNEVLNKGA